VPKEKQLDLPQLPTLYYINQSPSAEVGPEESVSKKFDLVDGFHSHLLNGFIDMLVKKIADMPAL